jgi:hypothetical protein
VSNATRCEQNSPSQADLSKGVLYKIGSLKSVSGMVGEHCSSLRRYTVRSAGGPARAYVDTSSENEGEKPSRRKPKVSCSKVNLLRVSRSLRRGREA